MSSGSQHDTFAGAWLRGSTQFFEGVLAANRAALAAFGGRESDDTPAEGALTGAERPGWEVDLTEHRRDALSVGDRVRFTKTLSDADVRAFARSSGDTNPLHLDEGFAERTRFGGRIVHGTLASGLVSAALARLPGLVVYLSQDVEFRNPIGIGDRATAECEIVEDLGEHRYRIATRVTTDDATAIDGEAVVLLDEVDD
jgi:acyl dehydratase